MRWRVLGTVVLLALAGCSGASTYGTGNSTTVTPASVPEPTVEDPSVPGLDRRSVDARRLGDAHAASLTGTYTRIVFLTVAVDDERRLSYRSMETIGLAPGESIRTRRFAGPAIEAFAPVAGNVSTVSERRYRAGDQRSRRRLVDGNASVIEESEPPPLESPIPSTSDSELVAALLSNSTVVERTPLGNYRLRGRAVGPAAVPGQLDGARNASVEAIVQSSGQSSGQVRYVSARYEATFQGERATVTIDVYWSPPAEPFLTPAWLDDE